MQETIAGIQKKIIFAPWWRVEWFGNTAGEYIIAFGVFLASLLLFRLVQLVILRHLSVLAQRTKTDIDDTLIDIVRSLRPPFYSFVAFYLALQFLVLPELLSTAINILLIVWVVYQMVVAAQILIEYVARKYLARNDEAAIHGAVGALVAIARAVLWVFAVLLVLSNLGVNVTSLIAGLGIGGIAVAFALQNILGDLFSSFAIFFDKPFVVGDFIKVGELAGTVKKIGIKTTRIKSLSGEEIIIPNKELTSSDVFNFKRMEERRVVYTLGVTYDTPNEKLAKIPLILQRIISEIEGVRFDRSHFKSFDDSSLTFETVFYVLSPNYVTYLDALQNINLAVKEAFEKERIDMAFPTQTVYLKQD